jgi:hypothetical protein
MNCALAFLQWRRLKAQKKRHPDQPGLNIRIGQRWRIHTIRRISGRYDGLFGYEWGFFRLGQYFTGFDGTLVRGAPALAGIFDYGPAYEQRSASQQFILARGG